jgi:exopolyphosphatase/guanosine-5'-triphosphate,3'-diphosphate pyrophosphatase
MIESILHHNDTEGPQEYVAALDLGTNTCRLLIAAVTPEGPQVVDSFVRVIRLGDQLATKGHISQEAMGRAIGALTICAKKIKSHNVSRKRCIATAACREASNREAFLEAIRSKTGLDLEVVSPAEEARLAIVALPLILEEEAQKSCGWNFFLISSLKSLNGRLFL